MWSEFLHSYWADNSLWPVTPGAEERASRLGVKEKAVTGAFALRPQRPTHVALPTEHIPVDVALKVEPDLDED